MKRMMMVLGLALFLVSTGSMADSVIRDGKEWLQPADFTNLSWNDAVAVCPVANNFLCDGELNGIDVTGYTFASTDQITDLFNSYGIDPPLGPAPDSVQEVDSTWAPAFFNEFAPTLTTQFVNYLSCIGSSPLVDGDVRIAVIQDDAPGRFDTAFNLDRFQLDWSSAQYAICLCRDCSPAPTAGPPTAVPTMSTYVLTFTMLGLIAIASGGLFRRKFKDG